MKLQLQPRVLRWARERAGMEPLALAEKLKTTADAVAAWETSGEILFGQMRKLARATHTPEGFLFLHEPPEDRLPIPDFRTLGDRPPGRPSPDLLETVHTMQQRQAWMRDHLIEEGAAPLPFVGSATLKDAPEGVAADMRRTLGFTYGWANEEKSWTDALMHLRQRIEAAGVLIVVNGVVGNNSHRKLDPDEFRGFAISDPFAPVIFINGADFKSAQMFTFAHELAHLWLGKDGVSNFEALMPPNGEIESWCNAVAAEFLVPERELRRCWDEALQSVEPFRFLARRFKVSAIVAARRALDLKLIERPDFFRFYEEHTNDERAKGAAQGSGGSFWNNQNVRVGSRFGTAVVTAAKEGRLLYREAYQLTGLRGETFTKFAKNLGLHMG